MTEERDPRRDGSLEAGRAASADSHDRGVIDDSSQESLLARIAELEEEVRALKAELAERDATVVRVRFDPSGSGQDVTADGTRGMERGV